MPGPKGFRYVYSPNHITRVLGKTRTLGRPGRLNFQYLRDTWLLRNKQYGGVLIILKDMGFIDGSGVPTELYAEYQNPSLAKRALAKGIKNAYPALFKAYPNAQSLPKQDLEGYFKQQTGKAGSVLDKMVSTFSALCKEADFAAVEVTHEEPTREHEAMEAVEGRGRVRVEPRVQVNVEIHIAADTPDDKIGMIFKNMKKYLLPNE